MEVVPAFITVADIDLSAVGLIIFVIIVLIVGTLVSVWLFRLRRRPYLRRCPYCDAIMQVDNNFCPNCGKETPPEPVLVE